MAARFETHCNDRVATVSFEPLRFPHRRGRADHARVRRLDAVEQILSGQAEMKADNFGLELLDEGARFGVERLAGGRGKWSLGIQSKLEIVRFEQRAPCKLALRLSNRWRVTEEVEIDWARCTAACRFECLSDLTATQLCARHRTQTAGLSDGCRQRSIAGASHRREDNRQLDSE